MDNVFNYVPLKIISLLFSQLMSENFSLKRTRKTYCSFLGLVFMSPRTVMSEKSILNLLSRVAILQRQSKNKKLWDECWEEDVRHFQFKELWIEITAMSHHEGQGKLL